MSETCCTADAELARALSLRGDVFLRRQGNAAGGICWSLEGVNGAPAAWLRFPDRAYFVDGQYVWPVKEAKQSGG